MNGHRVVFVIDGSEGWIETVRDGGVFVIDGSIPGMDRWRDGDRNCQETDEGGIAFCLENSGTIKLPQITITLVNQMYECYWSWSEG